VPLVERQYRLIAGLATDPETLLIANPGALAASVAAEKAGRSLATIILQPGLIPSSIAPPVMFGHPFPRWTPRWSLDLFWRFIDLVGDRLVGRHVNRLRASLGLRPVRRLFRNWLSPQLVLGLFPHWYGSPQADWPPQLRLAGFPLFDGSGRDGLPADLLEFCRAGKPPIVFTFGTGMMHAAKTFTTAMEACRLLDQRCIFLTKYRDQLPTPLPSFVRHFDFAPFQQLFPLCSAVVHHGGVGTVANSLAAAIPQLILPWAYDQTDNAVRVKRLGVGDWLPQRRITARSLANALARLMTPAIQDRCRTISAQFGKEPQKPLDLAADWLKELAARPDRATRPRGTDA
jgi:rhamnosyltransferase subunit B